jgi:hypothetical protein
MKVCEMGVFEMSGVVDRCWGVLVEICQKCLDEQLGRLPTPFILAP